MTVPDKVQASTSRTQQRVVVDLSSDVSSESKQVYEQTQNLLKLARKQLDTWEWRCDQIGNLRLAVAFACLFLLLLPLYSKSGTPWLWLLPSVVVFLVLAQVQDWFGDRRRRAKANHSYYENTILRLEGRWNEFSDHGKDVGEKWFTSHSHYASDLDLFGPNSLYQLLSRAVTDGGRRMLARWIAEPTTDGENCRASAVSKVFVGEFEYQG